MDAANGASGPKGVGGRDDADENARIRARARRVSEPESASEALDGVALFRELKRDARAALCGSVVECEYERGDVIVRKNEVGTHFYVVAHGCVRVDASEVGTRTGDYAGEASGEDDERRRHESRTRESSSSEREDASPMGGIALSYKLLYPGDTFGEVALVRKCPRTATVIAESSSVKLWALDRATFQETVKRTTFERRCRLTSYLDAVEVFRESLDARTMSMLVDALREVTFESGHVIVSPDDVYEEESSKFYVVIDGEAVVYVDDGSKAEVNRLRRGDYFGELSLIHKTSPTAMVIAVGQVSALTLDAESFYRMIGEKTVKLMARRIDSYTHTANKAERKLSKSCLSRCAGSFAALRGAMTSPFGWLSFDRRHAERQKISLNEIKRGRQTTSKKLSVDFDVHSSKDVLFVKEIGSGMLGSVFIAKTLNTQETCCVKVMHKWKIAHLDQEKNVCRELEIMKRFDSPFLTRAVGAFQDARSLYLLMDYLPGGDLFQLLVSGPYRGGRFPVNVAQFYAAEVFIALEYIHTEEYVYRDLKPENVLLDACGHVKLTDFGFCRHLLPGERAYTTCGTADYMAPEVMLAQGYDQLADYWSFGVLLYEMLVGYAPFASVSDGVRHRRIISSDLKFHSTYFSLTAKSLISRLCVVDVSKRLGSGARGSGDLKSHDFFRDLNWEDVTARRIDSPVRPPVRDRVSADVGSVGRHRSRELLRALDRACERERCERGARSSAQSADFVGF